MIAAPADVEEALRLKHGPAAAPGQWTLPMHRRFGYVSPDAWYEGTVLRLCQPGVAWLDVGAGCHVFPHNRRAAELLARRCRLLVGLDPSPNILANPHLHERLQRPVEACDPGRAFGLITLRMVAEHLADPAAAVAALARLLEPGGHVVVYTVSRFAPLSVLGAATPHRAHLLAMRALFHGAPRDTHPAYYRMNTRRRLRALFARHGLHEQDFRRLDDCRATIAHRRPHLAELTLWRTLRALRLPYPEACLLGVYAHRTAPAAATTRSTNAPALPK